MESEQKLPVKVGDLLGAGLAAEKAISAGEAFLKTLFGPMTREVGELFADPIREFRARRAKLVAARAQQKLERARARPGTVPPRVLIPLLEHASLEDDEALAHDGWHQGSRRCAPDVRHGSREGQCALDHLVALLQ